MALAVAALAAVAVLAVAVQSLGADESGTWEARTNVPDSRQEVSYVRVGTTLYLAGGSSIQRSYDAVGNTWNVHATDPLPSIGNLDHIQGVAVGGRIYYIGGLDRTADYPDGEVGSVQIFDPAAETITPGASMPDDRTRGAGAVAVFDGLIYYFGGLNDGDAKPWVDVYDPVEDGWTSLPDMPFSRDHSVAVPLGGLIHLIGGRDGPDFGTTTGSHRAYNPATGEWQNKQALPTARGGHAAAVLGGEIVVLGGETTGGTTPSISAVEAYAPASNSWRSLTSMPTPRHGIQAAVCSGSIYVAGGGPASASHFSDVNEAFSMPAGTC
jgi:N-acetylneuraminic acid mutarotase